MFHVELRTDEGHKIQLVAVVSYETRNLIAAMRSSSLASLERDGHCSMWNDIEREPVSRVSFHMKQGYGEVCPPVKSHQASKSADFGDRISEVIL